MGNTLPLACTLLIVALPAVYLVGWRLTGWLAFQPRARHLLAPVVALAAWQVAFAIIARATGSFVVGLSVGTISIALLGLMLTGRAPRSGTFDDERRTETAEPIRIRRQSTWMILSGLVTTLPVAFLAIRGHFFDEFLAMGHLSMIGQFQNDVFPLRHTAFPDHVFRYHYGFDAVAAALTGLFRISADAVMDLIVVVSFIWSWCLAWCLGERLTRSRTGWWTALGGLFGGGAFFWLLWYSDWVQRGAVGIVIGGNRINFPVIMYFFQKPFALGLPLGLAVLLVASFPPTGPGHRSRAVVLGLLLAALSISQTALFVALAPCVAAQELVRERRLRALLPVVLGVLLSLPMGGILFTRPSAESTPLIQARFWPAEDPIGMLAWYALTTGLLIPLSILGLSVMPRLRTLLLLLISGSFAVPLFFTVPMSWDIVKFATVGQLAAGLVGGSALAWLAETRSWRRRSALVLFSVLLVVSSLGSVGYWIKEMVQPGPEIGQKLAAQSRLVHDEDWERLVASLRERAPLHGAIYVDDSVLSPPGYRTASIARQLSYAGLGNAHAARRIDQAFGIPAGRIERRLAHLAELPRDPQSWIAEGITWVILRPKSPLREAVHEWVDAGQARRVAVSGIWDLYALGPEEIDFGFPPVGVAPVARWALERGTIDTTPASLASGIELLEAAVDAHGGREALAGFVSLHRKSMAMPGRRTEVEELLAYPQRYRRQVVWPEGSMLIVLSEAGCVTTSPDGTAPPPGSWCTIVEGDLDRTLPVLLRAFTEGRVEVEAAGHGEVGGVAVGLVQVALDGRSLRLAVDSETGRILQLRFPGGARRTYADYRDVDGLVLPFGLTVKRVAGPESRWIFTEVSVNVPVDAALFELGRDKGSTH